jgi:hypothetical protein
MVMANALSGLAIRSCDMLTVNLGVAAKRAILSARLDPPAGESQRLHPPPALVSNNVGGYLATIRGQRAAPWY